MTAVGEQFAESRLAIAGVFRNPSLRRLNLALVGSVIGDWAFTVALSIYAYRNGGATALGVLSVVRYLTMAVLASRAGRAGRQGRSPQVDDLRRRAACRPGLRRGGNRARRWPGAAGVRVVGVGGRRRIDVPARAGGAPAVAGEEPVGTDRGECRSPARSTASASSSDPWSPACCLAVADIGSVFAFNALTFVWSAVMVFGVRPATVVVETTDGVETLTDVERPCRREARPPTVAAAGSPRSPTAIGPSGAAGTCD